MKVIILAGGIGSRLSEETDIKPKPMVQIGNKPILWHIMKIYSYFGYNEFIILCGYKGYVIKEYFSNYYIHHSDLTIDLETNSMKIHNNQIEPWKVTLIDTGKDTMTGGRVLRAKPYIEKNERFMLTYGDGVANIKINEVVSFHQSHNGIVTLTSSQPEGRFGALDIYENGKVGKFTEKPKGDGSWINAGFFVCDYSFFDYIDNDETILEKQPLEKLAERNQLYSYKHHGFWHPMDTLRDKNNLEELWKNNNAPWKIW